MFKIPLSRSISKSTLFGYCKRKYYFQYYTSHLKQSVPDIRLEALLVKNIQSFDMWMGSKIHQLFSDYLHLYADSTYSKENLDKVLENIIKETKHELNLSTNKNYTTYDKYQKFWLSEHYFGETVDLDVGIKRIKDQFDNFIQSDLHKEIIHHFQTSTCFVETREPNFEQMKFELSHIDDLKGVTIFAQPDFGVKINDHSFIIYDWKSGRVPDKDSNKISDQLQVYAYKIRFKLNYPKEFNIEVKEVFMDQMKIFGGVVQESDLKNIEKMMIKQINEQKKFLKDIPNNIPKDISEFKKTTSKAKCKTCRFRRICKRSW